jgi:hypothetical protein
MVICLGWPSPATSSSLPAAYRNRSVWVTPRRLFGLAPTGGYRAAAVTSSAVGSYPTVSPLPVSGRSILCGPIRRLAAPRSYLAVYPMELGLSSGTLRHPRPSCLTSGGNIAGRRVGREGDDK